MFFATIPFSIFDAIRHLFSSYCEPSLSCLRVSELLMFASFVCAAMRNDGYYGSYFFWVFFLFVVGSAVFKFR